MSGTPRRMDDEAIARLEDLLERHAVPHEGMSLEMLDGFLAALVVGPGPVAAEEYQQLIWNREPQWTWADDRREAEALIERLRDDVLWRVTRDLPDDSDLSPQAAAELDAVNPLMAMPDEADGLADGDDPFANVDPAFPLAAEWAHGFLTAVALREDEWRSWANDEEQIDEDLGDLMRLALVDPEQATAMGIEDGGIPDFSERMEMVAVLPYMLQDIHLFRMERLRPSPVVRAPVPGRNDPCPCGSGEKFKKCCGAPGRLN